MIYLTISNTCKEDIGETMNISIEERPSVLLVGNGISRACSSIMSKSWDDLIQKIYDKYNDG